MNSICKALCNESGVESKFGVSVGRVEWLDDAKLWSLIGVDGQNLGQFKGLVASDKNIVLPRIAEVTGRPPPLDLKLVPELSEKLHNLAARPCFAVMLAFADPLPSIPAVKGFSFQNSKLLSWAFCESSKPSRSTACERWVLHSTSEYAADIIAQTGLKKPSDTTLNKVAEQLLQNTLTKKKEELENVKTHDVIDVSLNRVMDQKEKMIKSYNEEIKKAHERDRDRLERVFTDHEKARMRLEAEKKELENIEYDLLKREVRNDNERKKLYYSHLFACICIAHAIYCVLTVIAIFEDFQSFNSIILFCE